MKHYKARLQSKCVICTGIVWPGEMVVLLSGSKCNKLHMKPEWRNHWVHKKCYKLIYGDNHDLGL